MADFFGRAFRRPNSHPAGDRVSGGETYGVAVGPPAPMRVNYMLGIPAPWSEERTECLPAARRPPRRRSPTAARGGPGGAGGTTRARWGPFFVAGRRTASG